VRIAFWGTPDPAVPSLRALLAADDVEVAAVITNPDRPSGRGHRLAAPPVKLAAAEAGVPVWQPRRPRESLDDLRALGVDACAVVAYGSILPTDVLAAGGAGFVNLHFSLLPAWRGAAPVQASILAGDAVTGVTCFVLEAGMDTGPVLVGRETEVGPEETAGELVSRLAELGAPALVEAVRGLVDGSLQPVPQDAERATLAPKIAPEDARLDWTRDAAALHRAVRAYSPAPGAYTHLDGLRVKVHRARVREGSEPVDRSAPGRVVSVDDDGPVVACGSGALALTEVQPAGKPRMAGSAFANGYPVRGAVLGGG